MCSTQCKLEPAMKMDTALSVHQCLQQPFKMVSLVHIANSLCMRGIQNVYTPRFHHLHL